MSGGDSVLLNTSVGGFCAQGITRPPLAPREPNRRKLSRHCSTCSVGPSVWEVFSPSSTRPPRTKNRPRTGNDNERAANKGPTFVLLSHPTTFVWRIFSHGKRVGGAPMCPNFRSCSLQHTDICGWLYWRLQCACCKSHFRPHRFLTGQ